ncbi:MAG: BON domain-containing protein [Burkholderiales bacterium]|nr:BON domain-containing protein [Burkholderiales bacterium]
MSFNAKRIVALFLAVGTVPTLADGPVQLDPFAMATSGHPNCPPVAPPLLTREQVERSAHARAERGTRCAMEGTCEPGGAYRRDPEINEAVRSAIAGDHRFAGTSIGVTTSRGWVTLQGCVRNARQRDQLVAVVKRLPRVALVFDETRTIAVKASPRRPVS